MSAQRQAAPAFLPGMKLAVRREAPGLVAAVPRGVWPLVCAAMG